MIDHASIDATYEALCPNARVMPPIDLHPIGGHPNFYERTTHVKDVSQRFAVACSLRSAMAEAVNNVIMGGDVWIKPRLTGVAP